MQRPGTMAAGLQTHPPSIQQSQGPCQPCKACKPEQDVGAHVRSLPRLSMPASTDLHRCRAGPHTQQRCSQPPSVAALHGQASQASHEPCRWRQGQATAHARDGRASCTLGSQHTPGPVGSNSAHENQHCGWRSMRMASGSIQGPGAGSKGSAASMRPDQQTGRVQSDVKMHTETHRADGLGGDPGPRHRLCGQDVLRPAGARSSEPGHEAARCARAVQPHAARQRTGRSARKVGGGCVSGGLLGVAVLLRATSAECMSQLSARPDVLQACCSRTPCTVQPHTARQRHGCCCCEPRKRLHPAHRGEDLACACRCAGCRAPMRHRAAQSARLPPRQVPLRTLQAMEPAACRA